MRKLSWLYIEQLFVATHSRQSTLRREVEANVRERNLKATPINWRFTTQDARRKRARFYPCVSS